MSTYKPMAPCPECDRHIRISENRCPFCGEQLRDPLAAAPDTSRRMTRAAAFLFGATVAVAACGETVETDDGSTATQSSSGTGSGQPLYGAPAVGGGGGSAGSAGIGGNQAMYGAPAVGGGGGAGAAGGAGGFSADYGAPPLPPSD